MKKILFVSTRNPYSGRYSGDVIASKKILDTLKKKNNVDLVTIGRKKNFTQKNVFIFKQPSFFLKVIYLFKSILTLKPFQFGIFFSNEMFKFIEGRALDYDLIFFYHIRSSQYLPRNFYGKTVIEMGDLYSSNYKQTFQKLNILNPFKYIYLLESLLVKRLEKKIFTDFDKIILFSEDEIRKIDKSFTKKIIQMNLSIEKIKKKYFFSKKNKKILFVGNLRYLPNIFAVKKFVKNILPKLEKKIPEISFEIIGEIGSIDKFLLSMNKKVKCLGPQKNLDKYIKGTFCALANIEIATGVQTKVLSYMSYGLPVICSSVIASNFKKNVLSYKNDNDLFEKIYNLKNNRNLSNKISKKSLFFIKKYDWKKISKEYLKIIRF
tara:strand:- start:4117 stop:5250 length:1134 start_codon:yes stop_codon:yes gene_type:complete